MLLIDDLLFAPFSGWNFIMRTLLKVAEEQYTDDAPLKEQLLELQVKLDSGEITEDQYVEEEARILRSLRDIQNYKREKAGLPAEDGRGLSGAVREGSGVSLTWDAETNENAGYAASDINTPVEGTSVPDLGTAEPEVTAPARKKRNKKR